MCLLCVEIAKETIKPKDFWRNYRELLLTEEDSHSKQVIEEVKKTSEAYQLELANFMSNPKKA